MIEDTPAGFENETVAAFDTLADRFGDVEVLRKSIFRECASYMMADQKTSTNVQPTCCRPTFLSAVPIPPANWVRPSCTFNLAIDWKSTAIKKP
jgi:hypothetical protein